MYTSEASKKLILAAAWKERSRLIAGERRLRDKANKLREEAVELWHDAVLETCGNIVIEWVNFDDEKGYECHLETGEVFKP